MFRTAMTRTLLLRGVLAATAFAVVTPAAVYSTTADAKRSRKSSKAKLKAKAAKAKKEKAKKEAAAKAAKAKKEMHLKRLGKIERLEQIAKVTENKELMDVVTRLKEKHQKLHDK